MQLWCVIVTQNKNWFIVFRYLLWVSHTLKMVFGAPRYLKTEFGLDKEQLLSNQHAVIRAAARHWAQKKRSDYRENLWKEHSYSYAAQREQELRERKKDQGDKNGGGAQNGSEKVAPNKPGLADDEAANEVRRAQEREFFEVLVEHNLLAPNLILSYFSWEGEIPHAFGLVSTTGGGQDGAPGRGAPASRQHEKNNLGKNRAPSYAPIVLVIHFFSAGIA